MKSIILNSKLHIVLAVLMYILAPRQYDYWFCVCLCVLFLIMAIKSVIFEFESKNYLSFNLIFMLSLFFVYFYCTYIFMPFRVLLVCRI